MKKKEKIRKEFRDSTFERDNFTCQICGEKRLPGELDAHHITDRSEMPEGGYVKENGITLCKRECHLKAELFHLSGGKEWHPGLHPEDLYRKIGSSLELAVEKSKKLQRW